MDAEERLRRFVDSVIDRALDGAREADQCGKGGRNDALNRAALRLGHLVGAGLLDERAAEAVLLASMPGYLQDDGLQAARATIRSGLAAGRRHPLEVPADLQDALRDLPTPSRPTRRYRSTPTPKAPPRAAERPAASPDRLPEAEVSALWSAARPVTEVERVLRWCRSEKRDGTPRGIDPARVAAHDLARALLPDAPCPAWAHMAVGVGLDRRLLCWSQGWNLLLPCFDATGARVGFKARWCATAPGPEGRRIERPAPEDRLKEISPVGPRRLVGAVYADPVALGILRQGPVLAPGDAPDPTAPGLRWDGRVLIVEGGPEWLLQAAGRTPRPQESGYYATHAVIGVWNGAWPADRIGAELAARFHPSTRVVIGTDTDAAGDRYAERAATTLAERGIRVRRWKPQEVMDGPVAR